MNVHNIAGHVCSPICVRVGCANYTALNATWHAFELLCPNGLDIVTVECARNNKKPYCMWLVKYIYTDQNKDIIWATQNEIKQSFTKLVQLVPIGLSVFRKSKRYDVTNQKMTYCVEFEVTTCTCAKEDFESILTHLNFGVFLIKNEVNYVDLEREGGITICSPKVFFDWQADQHKFPRIAFGKKMDRSVADFEGTVEDFKRKLDTVPAVLQWPMIENTKFGGVVDIFSKQQLMFDNDGRKFLMVPLKSEMEECFDKDSVGEIFKVTHDKQKGALSLIRILSGKLCNESKIVTLRGNSENVSKLYKADEYREIQEVGDGDIAICGGLMVKRICYIAGPSATHFKGELHLEIVKSRLMSEWMDSCVSQ